MLEKILHIDLIALIRTTSYIGIFGIVFAESGLLVGFFLPGDSLLFTAGFLAEQGYLNIYILCAVVFAGAVLGDSAGYWFGRKVGPKIFNRPDSLLFHHTHLEKARIFYERHGGKTIIIARFMLVVRTFAPIVAGVGRMHYPLFLTYNLIGGALWGIGLPGSAYLLSGLIPNLEQYLSEVIIVIILLSLAPTVIHVARDAQSRAHVKEMGRRILNVFKQKFFGSAQK